MERGRGRPQQIRHLAHRPRPAANAQALMAPRPQLDPGTPGGTMHDGRPRPSVRDRADVTRQTHCPPVASVSNRCPLSRDLNEVERVIAGHFQAVARPLGGSPASGTGSGSVRRPRRRSRICSRCSRSPRPQPRGLSVELCDPSTAAVAPLDRSDVDPGFLLRRPSVASHLGVASVRPSPIMLR
jgi:hypothetical protein